MKLSQAPYSLGFTTQNRETSIDNLPVQGKLPDWLRGSLLRTGPAQFEVGGRSYNHWFDGLAMLHKFAFAEGRVSYANRFLRSQTYREIQETGRISRGEFATDPCWTLFQRIASWFSPKITDNGCVNLIQLADEMVALTETRLPVRVDPQTLQTLGNWEYDPQIPGPLSIAHPHFDAARRRHFSYLLELGWKSKYHLFGIDQQTGQQSPVATVPVRRPAYVHSIGMTERYLVLAEFPFVVNPLWLKFSGQPYIRNYTWQPERGSRFHLIEKDTGQVVRTVEGEACFCFHHVNAFETGGEVFVDVVAHPDSTIVDQLYLGHLRSSEPVAATGKLVRFRIGSGDSASQKTLSEESLELPRINYRQRAGQAYRYVYGAGNAVPGNFIDQLVKFDLEQQTTRAWQEPDCYPGEPVFVPAPESTGEDHGVILSVVLDMRNARSFLLILEAASFQELARAEVPHHISFGFHGNYLAEPTGPVSVRELHS